MAKKNHVQAAATSVLAHVAEMLDEKRSHAAIKKYLKTGLTLLKQAAHLDTEVTDAPERAPGQKGRGRPAESIQAAPTANGPVPIVNPGIASAKIEAEKPRGGIFGKS